MEKIEVTVRANNSGVLLSELKEIFKPLYQLNEKKIQVFVHGSWADNSRTAFSDIDDFIVVDDDYLEEAQAVLNEIEICFQKIDPLQHHGHWLVKRSTLENYDNSFMPLFIMENAISIYGDNHIQANINTNVTKENNLKRISNTLRNIRSFYSELEKENLNIYNLKRFVGSIILIPPLLFQINDISLDKKNAIDRAQEVLSENGLKLLSWASEVRNNWEKFQKFEGYKDLIRKVALTKNARTWRVYCENESVKLPPANATCTMISESWINSFIEDSMQQIDRVRLQKMTNEDYIMAYEFVEKSAQKEKAILVGKFGSIKNPGISDLDVFICFEDEDYKKGCEVIEKLIRDNLSLRYLFTHTPLYCSRSSLNYVHLLHTMYDLELTWNPEDIRLNNFITAEYKDFLSLSWSWILFRNSHSYTKQEIEVTDIRILLLLLKNIHTSIDNLNRMHDLPQSNSIELTREIRSSFMHDKISRIEVRDQVTKAISNLKKLVSQISNKITPKSKLVFSWKNHILTPDLEWEKNVKFGVTYENVPVLFFNFLKRVSDGRDHTARTFLNAIKSIRKNHQKTGGYFNYHIISGIPPGFYDKSLYERRKEKMKFQLKRFLKNLFYTV